LYKAIRREKDGVERLFLLPFCLFVDLSNR